MPSSWMILSVAKNSPGNTPAGGQAGQGRQRHQRGTLAQGLSVVALHAPDGGDDRRIHAVAGRGALQIRPPALHARLAIGHALVIDQRRHVVPDGRAELGLEIQQIQHAHVGRQRRRVGIEGGGRHAGFQRRRAQPGRQPSKLSAATAAWRAASGQRGGQQQRAGSCEARRDGGDGMGGFHPVGSHDYRVGEAACKAASSVSSKPAARRASRLNGPRRRGAPCNCASSA